MITGNRIAELRKELNMRQKDLASHLNTSVSTVSNYENSVNAIDIETLDKLADFFGVTTDYLIGRTDYRCPPDMLQRFREEDIYIKEINDTMLTLSPSARNSVVEYVRYIAYKSKHRG